MIWINQKFQHNSLRSELQISCFTMDAEAPIINYHNRSHNKVAELVSALPCRQRIRKPRVTSHADVLCSVNTMPLSAPSVLCECLLLSHYQLRSIAHRHCLFENPSQSLFYLSRPQSTSKFKFKLLRNGLRSEIWHQGPGFDRIWWIWVR